MGGWRSGTQQPAILRSAWYRLPPRDEAGPVLVVAAAGRFDQGEVVVQWATDEQAANGEPGGSVSFGDVGASPAWRNLRVPMNPIPQEATQVRLVATDDDLNPQHWIALTPPRNPQLRTLQDVVGSTRIRCCWTGWSAWPSPASARPRAPRTASLRCRNGESCRTGSGPRQTHR